MIVVLHRERSEKLASRFAEEIGGYFPDSGWADLDPERRETLVRAFDALIQDGLICEEQHRPEGRE